MTWRAQQRQAAIGSLIVGGLIMASCGVTSTQKTTRGPDSTNRDPRGSVEYCSDAERAKVDTKCGAEEDKNPVQVALDGNPTLATVAGTGLLIPITITLRDPKQEVSSTTLTVTSSSSSGIPTQTAEVAGYAAGTNLCVFVPATTEPGKYQLTIAATSLLTAEGWATEELRSGNLTLPFQVSKAATGASGSASTVCPGTKIVTDMPSRTTD